MTDFPPNLSIRPLTIQDLNLCVDLEAKGFPEAERASEEKLQYRLTVCPELCSGLFVREYGYKYNSINLPETAKRLETEAREKSSHSESDEDNNGPNEKLPIRLSVVKETLIGHIIATKIFSDKITNSSMELPLSEDRSKGHIEQSRTIGVHGVVIDPEWQGKNLGTLLMHDYIQKLSSQDLGSRVVIIAHEGLVPFYEKIGFVNHGESQCKFANECWYDLSIDLISQEE